jgi:hypothetical protein
MSETSLFKQYEKMSRLPLSFWVSGFIVLI